VPYEEQQLVALDWGPNGENILDTSDDEQAHLAAVIRSALSS
jgi:hypothetical protein